VIHQQEEVQCMKKLFIIAAFVLVPVTVCAQTPFGAVFQKAADRLGLQPEVLQQVIRFAEKLQDDMLADYSINSIYPPVLDITFASGREIHADGNRLQLIDGTEKEIDAEIVCPILLALGAILTWTGFFLLSLPIFVGGIEILLLTAYICL